MKIKLPFLVFFIFIFFSLNYTFAGDGNMDFKTINLSNGTKIKHLYRDNIPIVYVTVLIPASPLDETKPSQAYLTAHMLTHGTKNRSARQIEDEIDFLAISIEKKVTHDYTMLTLASTKRHLKRAVELLFDILKNPIFPEDEFIKEVTILEKSLRQMEQDPSFIANKKFLLRLFGKHPYGRPVEGEPETLKNLKREDLIEFYNRFYKPDKMIFSFVGDLNDKELDEIKKHYMENWKGKSSERKISPPEFTKRDKVNEVLIKRDDLLQSTIILGQEGISRKDDDFYAFSLMNYILGGGGLTSRLAKKVREEKGFAYSIYSTFTPYLLPGSFYIEVKTKAENAQNVIKIIKDELKKISSHGVTEEEIKEAKQFLTGSFPLRFDTMRKVSEFLPLLEFYELGDDYFLKYAEYINKITNQDILRVSKRILNQNYIIVIVGPP
ncbi:MAG: insulinase family protein [Thermodesulfovibrio sp.]|nr:insulinase family protein [Thermodesulfovibrio sp.]